MQPEVMQLTKPVLLLLDASFIHQFIVHEMPLNYTKKGANSKNKKELHSVRKFALLLKVLSWLIIANLSYFLKLLFSKELRGFSCLRSQYPHSKNFYLLVSVWNCFVDYWLNHWQCLVLHFFQWRCAHRPALSCDAHLSPANTIEPLQVGVISFGHPQDRHYLAHVFSLIKHDNRTNYATPCLNPYKFSITHTLQLAFLTMGYRPDMICPSLTFECHRSSP